MKFPHVHLYEFVQLDEGIYFYQLLNFFKTTGMKNYRACLF